jgi:hypothetical protein
MASTEVMNRAEESVDLSSLAPEHVQHESVLPDKEAEKDFYGRLMKGEIVEPLGLECHLSLPYLRSRICGTVFFSNYKLLFVIAQNHPTSALLKNELELQELLRVTTPVPFLCIANLRLVDENAAFWGRVATPQPAASFDVEVTTKDVRFLRYHFVSVETRRQFVSKIQELAFFGAHALPTKVFAPAHRAKRLESSNHALESTGWKYSAQEEYERLSKRPCGSNFKLFDQGEQYSIFSTYPRYIMIPETVPDALMLEVAAYRSSQRVPAVDWIHPTSGASLSRCSQPKTGFSTYSEADQRLMKDIWAANDNYAEESENKAGQPSPVMLIMDARSRAAATANIVVGGGYEGTTGYGRCKLEFAGIANIHAVRESFLALAAICSENKITEKSDVAATQWYYHISTILTAAMAMVNAMESGASVMTHCSDGWDRTSQLTSLVQLVLDPYARTAEGFAKLLQKEWLSFGHKFRERLAFGEAVIPNSAGASPVFLQFLDSVAAILKAYPTSFEFSEHFLIHLFDLIHSGRFGDFLANYEAEYIAKYKNHTASLWHQLEHDWHKPSGAPLRNTHYNAQSGPINLAPVIQSLDLWSAFFHRYNAQYVEQLKQKRMMFYSTHRQLLSASLMNGDPSAETSIWKRVFATAEQTDSVSSEVRSQIAYLHELLNNGQPECQVRLHFHGDEVVQMVVQQNSAFRVQKLVPSLKEATLEFYTPSAKSSHPPNSLVVLSATSVLGPDGTRAYQSKILSSNYRALVETVASWGRMLWRSASSVVDTFSWGGFSGSTSGASCADPTSQANLNIDVNSNVYLNPPINSGYDQTNPSQDVSTFPRVTLLDVPVPREIHSAPASTTSSTQIPVIATTCSEPPPVPTNSQTTSTDSLSSSDSPSPPSLSASPASIVED